MADWVLLVVTGQFRDVAVERGREQYRLAVVVGLVKNAPHRRHEAHIGHAVCLVEHDSFDIRKIDVAALDQVFEAAGACNENVDALFEQPHLFAVTNTAIHNADLYRLGERCKFCVNLVGEFASWRKNERRREVGASLREICDDRDTKGDRLAGTRRGTAEDVSAGKAVSKCCGLDFEGRVNVLTCQGITNRLWYAEFSEGGRVSGHRRLQGAAFRAAARFGFRLRPGRYVGVISLREAHVEKAKPVLLCEPTRQDVARRNTYGMSVLLQKC